MILPIIMILFCALLGIGTYLFLKVSGKKKNDTTPETIAEKTANEFVNVKDIRDKFLYTKDGLIMSYLKITPISVDLFSKNEKMGIVKRLTAELSGLQYPFKFIAVSRPVDISPLIQELMDCLATSDPKQKELLKQEISEMNNFAIGGEVIERQFYILIWMKAEVQENGISSVERDIYNRLKDLASKFSGCGVSCEILGQQDIVRLCNLVNNPAYMHMEDTDFEAAIPLLGGGIRLD